MSRTACAGWRRRCCGWRRGGEGGGGGGQAPPLQSHRAISTDHLFLEDERQVLLLEAVEKLRPGDLLQGFPAVVVGKVDPQSSRDLAVPGVYNRRRAASALLGPTADLFMIGGRPGFRHGLHPFPGECCDSLKPSTSVWGATFGLTYTAVVRS